MEGNKMNNMMVFEKIKEEIMDDPMNKSYTSRGIPPLFKAAKDARIAQLPMDFYFPGKAKTGDKPPLVHPSPLNIGWLKGNPWFQKDVLPVLRKIIMESVYI